MSGATLESSTGEVLAHTLEWARTLSRRMRGLIGRAPPLAPGHALVIERASQVHTFGVREPIDIVFCDESWIVRHIVRSMHPYRVSRWVARCRYAVELPGGTVGSLDTGDRLVLRTADGPGTQPESSDP
jgi:uncharacterized membrane protein (UPF0127 family)